MTASSVFVQDHASIPNDELMEPATSTLGPSSTVPKDPAKWRDDLGIKVFPGTTQRHPLFQLKAASLPTTLEVCVLT